MGHDWIFGEQDFADWCRLTNLPTMILSKQRDNNYHSITSSTKLSTEANRQNIGRRYIKYWSPIGDANTVFDLSTTEEVL